MQTKSSKVGKISWTVHIECGRDVALKRQLYAKVYNRELGENDPEWGLWVDFIDAYVQSTDVSVPFEWPVFTLDIEKLTTVRDAWLALPSKVYRRWKDDLSEIEPTGDEDLLPPNMLPKGGAPTPESQTSELNSVAS